MTSMAFSIFSSGRMVMGSTIMPLSWRLTLSTSSAWSSIDMLRWMIPIPPCWARAMAIRDVVTVSMAELTIGMLRGMFRLRRVPTSASAGFDVGLGGEDEDVVEGQPFLDVGVQHGASLPYLFRFAAGDRRPGLPAPSAPRSPRRRLRTSGNTGGAPASGRWGASSETHGLDEEEVAQGVLLDPVHHRLEHLVAFLLVFDQRVPLAVTPQADALLEVVHLEEVVLPLGVDDLEEDHPLELPHPLGPEELFLVFVGRPRGRRGSSPGGPR